MSAFTCFPFLQEGLCYSIFLLIRGVWTVKLSVILPLIVVTDHTIIIRPAGPASCDAA